MQRKRIETCEEHEVPKKYLCEDCDETLCPECFYEGHAQHKKVLLKTKYEEAKKEIEKSMEV